MCEIRIPVKKLPHNPEECLYAVKSEQDANYFCSHSLCQKLCTLTVGVHCMFLYEDTSSVLDNKKS